MATSEKKGVNFLAESHTRKHMRSELYMPRLADRSRRSTWRKKGAKDIIERAREKVDKILEEHQPNELEKNMEAILLKYIEKVEARTFDDYRKAEGLMVDTITLPDGIEIKEKE